MIKMAEMQAQPFYMVQVIRKVLYMVQRFQPVSQETDSSELAPSPPSTPPP